MYQYLLNKMLSVIGFASFIKDPAQKLAWYEYSNIDVGEYSTYDVNEFNGWCLWIQMQVSMDSTVGVHEFKCRYRWIQQLSVSEFNDWCQWIQRLVSVNSALSISELKCLFRWNSNIHIKLQIHSDTLLQNDVLHLLFFLLLHLLKINSEPKIKIPNNVPIPIK
jgi:hypothetical protein